ncbi:unnamed protein product [Brassica napus]|uniref:(rape) hypothetical protein n=1 Tax=Brassica napus TaxID=3708 RepID=A0A816SJ97_BRANA|nr:unnamed protein product [Brassica napus]
MITCKTDAAWNKDTKLEGFGWIFEGSTLISPISAGSLLIAEAIAVRSALCMVITWRSYL